MPARIRPKRPQPVYLSQHREAFGRRRGRDLTQDELGDRFDPPVEKSSVSRWEKQARIAGDLTIAVCQAYAEALDLDDWTDLFRPPSEELTEAEKAARWDDARRALEGRRRRG